MNSNESQNEQLVSKDDLKPSDTHMFEQILSSGSEIFYRSQQRGEGDLTESDKLSILKELFVAKPAVFLERYHRYIGSDFSNLFDSTGGDERVKMYIEAIKERERIANISAKEDKRPPSVRGKNVIGNTETRNRRYAELLKLRSGGTYFSNEKMREREPLLFDMMVGKYLNDDAKVHLRPTMDLKFSNDAEKSQFTSLMEQFDETQRISDRRNLQWDDMAACSSSDFTDRFMNHVDHRIVQDDAGEEDFEMEFDSSDEEGRQMELERQRNQRLRRRRNFGALADEPPFMRHQRKGLQRQAEQRAEDQFSALRLSKPKTSIDDNESNDQANNTRQVAGGDEEEWSSGDENENLATGISKDQLREEFVSIMEQRFLNGHDVEFFDYSVLESDAWYNENKTLNRMQEQDLEDAYFADS